MAAGGHRFAGAGVLATAPTLPRLVLLRHPCAGRPQPSCVRPTWRSGGPGRRREPSYPFVMPMRLSAAAACGDSCPVTGTLRPPTDGQAIGASEPSAAYSCAGVFGLLAGRSGASSCWAPRWRDLLSMCTSLIEADQRCVELYPARRHGSRRPSRQPFGAGPASACRAPQARQTRSVAGAAQRRRSSRAPGSRPGGERAG